MKKGLFVTFEGIDGSGKSTQVNLLVKHIEKLDKYIDVLKTHEPWRSKEIKKKLREDYDVYSDGLQMANLYVEDRIKHTSYLIEPNLKRGAFVLCDRYSMSTLAYQWAQGVDLNDLLNLHKGRGILIPDLVFVFDLPAKESFKRMSKRGLEAEKFEKDKKFIENLIEKYKELSRITGYKENKLPFKKVIVINANKSIANIHNQVVESFDEVYNEWKKDDLN